MNARGAGVVEGDLAQPALSKLFFGKTTGHYFA